MSNKVSSQKIFRLQLWICTVSILLVLLDIFHIMLQSPYRRVPEIFVRLLLDTTVYRRHEPPVYVSNLRRSMPSQHPNALLSLPTDQQAACVLSFIDERQLYLHPLPAYAVKEIFVDLSSYLLFSM